MANNIKNAIINANKAVASVNANPKIQYLNKSSDKSGFLETAIKNEPKTIPIPVPAPAKPNVDNPQFVYITTYCIKPKIYGKIEIKA